MKSQSMREDEIYKVTLWGSFVNFVLVVLKLIAGIVGYSAAMIADAVHSLSDFATDIIVIIFVRISAKPQDEGHDYGHGKFETLATVIIGTILFIVGVGIMLNSLGGIIDVFRGQELKAPSMLALISAIISIFAKEGLYQYTSHKGRALNSSAVIANAWHHRSDAFSSIGTLVGISGAMFLGVRWRVLDLIAALVVSIFIVRVAIMLVKPCIDELLEKSLPQETEERILDIILSHPEVSAPHNLRTRRIGNSIAIEVHIRMNGQITLHEAHRITQMIEVALRREFGQRTHIGIHMEPQK